MRPAPRRHRDRLRDCLATEREPHGRRWHLQPPTDDSDPRAVRPLLLVLGLPTLGLAFAISILTTYGPIVLLSVAHSPSRVGALIGGEGAFALVVPLLAGGLSDRVPDRGLGRRLPFVLAGTPLLVVGLVLLPAASSYVWAAMSVLLFFVGYYLFYPPYRAMYADLLPRGLYARAQASQAILRGLGLGAALLAGGLLLDVWRPLPFVIAAAVVVATTLALGPVVALEHDGGKQALDYGATSVRALFRSRRMQLFAAANALWELSFAGLKSFIVLYVVKGLGRSPAMASLTIAVVAVAYVAAAPLASRLAERYGLVDVMTGAAIVFGIGLFAGVVPTTLTPGLLLLPGTALGGAVLLTLPQALAFTVAPRGGQGAAAGIVDLSRGIGVVLGPLLVGVAVGAAGSAFPATHGYAAMWPVLGIAVLASVPLLRQLAGPERELPQPWSESPSSLYASR